MVKVITVSASDRNTTVASTLQELQQVVRVEQARRPGMAQATVEVVVDANVRSVNLATRPVASERALKTQRLNRALELGYSPPRQSTRAK